MKSVTLEKMKGGGVKENNMLYCDPNNPQYTVGKGIGS